MLPARTPTDPMFVNATLDLMEMVKTAKVNLIFFAKTSRKFLLESDLKLLRRLLSAILLVFHM